MLANTVTTRFWCRARPPYASDRCSFFGDEPTLTPVELRPRFVWGQITAGIFMESFVAVVQELSMFAPTLTLTLTLTLTPTLTLTLTPTPTPTLAYPCSYSYPYPYPHPYPCSYPCP